MSHLLLLKKYGIIILIVACTFMGMAYAWVYYTDQWIARSDLPVQEPAAEATEESAEEAALAEKVAFYTQDPLEEDSFDGSTIQYPCFIKMKQGKIGVFTQDDVCMQELMQVGELLSETDQSLLMQGISVENEQELFMVLESYHLQ